MQRLVAEEQARQAKLRRQAQARLVQQQAAAAASQRGTRAGPNRRCVQRICCTVLSHRRSIPIAPPADASRGAQVVSIAMQYLGIPYVWGAASPSSGFDCSGLTTYVFAQIGVSLPHYAAAQYGYGVAVSRDQLQPVISFSSAASAIWGCTSEVAASSTHPTPAMWSRSHRCRRATTPRTG